jgi:hypothetical protein
MNLFGFFIGRITLPTCPVSEKFKLTGFCCKYDQNGGFYAENDKS